MPPNSESKGGAVPNARGTMLMHMVSKCTPTWSTVRNWPYLTLTVLIGITAACYTTYALMYPFFPLEVRKRGLPNWVAGAILSSYMIFVPIATRLQEWLICRYGARRCMLCAASVACLVSLAWAQLAANAHTATSFAAGSLLLRLAQSCGDIFQEVSATAYVLHYYAHCAGFASGILSMTYNFAHCVALPLGGLLYGDGDFQMPLYVSATAIAVCLVPAVLLVNDDTAGRAYESVGGDEAASVPAPLDKAGGDVNKNTEQRAGGGAIITVTEQTPPAETAGAGTRRCSSYQLLKCTALAPLNVFMFTLAFMHGAEEVSYSLRYQSLYKIDSEGVAMIEVWMPITNVISGLLLSRYIDLGYAWHMLTAGGCLCGLSIAMLGPLNRWWDSQLASCISAALSGLGRTGGMNPLVYTLHKVAAGAQANFDQDKRLNAVVSSYYMSAYSLFHGVGGTLAWLLADESVLGFDSAFFIFAAAMLLATTYFTLSAAMKSALK